MKLTLLLLVLLDYIENTSSVPSLTQLATNINKLNSEVKIVNKKKQLFQTIVIFMQRVNAVNVSAWLITMLETSAIVIALI